MTPQQRAIRRRQFFDYVRLRLRTVSSSDLQLPDRLILLGALFDALAKHWWSTSQTSSLGGVQRMHRFLLTHGEHAAFERVSAPLLYGERLEDQARAALEKLFPFERYFSNRGRPKEVATWRDDPAMTTVEQIPGLDPEQAVGCSYGGLFYTRLRNPWLHDLYPSRFDMSVVARDAIEETPYYRRVEQLLEDPSEDWFLLELPIAFVIGTAERAIFSFEREATERDILPFREKR